MLNRRQAGFTLIELVDRHYRHPGGHSLPGLRACRENARKATALELQTVVEWRCRSRPGLRRVRCPIPRGRHGYEISWTELLMPYIKNSSSVDVPEPAPGDGLRRDVPAHLKCVYSPGEVQAPADVVAIWRPPGATRAIRP